MARVFNIITILALLVACESRQSGDMVGQPGSMTRFAINGNYMYVVSSTNLTVYEITKGNFRQVDEIPVEWGLETISTMNDYLYLGTRAAMYIYSIADRTRPQFIFRYAHIRSCDPVVVQGNRAYVTLRNGTNCGGGENVLDVIDISDPNAPKLITQFALESPGGLGVNGNCLFVCEGAYGLKMLNVANDKVEVINELKDIHAYDVIVQSGSVTVTGEDGVFQYTYDCATATMDLVSKIPVVRAEL